MSTENENWTKIEKAPYYLAPDSQWIKHLWVKEEYRGRTRQMSYHDETPIKFKVCWKSAKTGEEIPFVWEEAPAIIQNEIKYRLPRKHNPWLGCYWSDDFEGARGDELEIRENYPIGD